MAEEDFSIHVVAIINHAHSGILDLTWSDGRYQHLSHGLLRARCKCADCIAGTAKANPRAQEDTDLRLTDIRSVGTYGLQLVFNDGHDRGIYPWAYLHELGETGLASITPR